MKTKLSLLFQLVLTSGVFAAGAVVDLPRGTIEGADFAKAQELATTEKKNIAYIYTDKATTCPLCEGASNEFIKSVRSKSVFVYLDSKAASTYWGKLPAPVRDTIAKSKIIPIMVVTSADGKTVLSSINYETYAKDTKASLRDFKKPLKD
ncbi:hypothetical protein KBB96_06075 [Luteolibacter ambystomatis]|uniref:Thioredoxin family protein n=1 Tax=Luteolibacter ambystomatis TaxID=2824561 RepID=A0A975J1V8_9BACT|nr:hypothetical protein [Luteolibacter ambystomatis]QUE52457.1 hypothetical protein KBB96_06075 [Luteolibacter ambystomatis]